MIETRSVGQETYINILTNRFHPWLTNVTLHQEREFTFQEDSASCHTGGLCLMVEGNPDLNPIKHVWKVLER
jgi:hypothetical protein